jgi:hypothetical protein
MASELACRTSYLQRRGGRSCHDRAGTGMLTLAGQMRRPIPPIRRLLLLSWSVRQQRRRRAGGPAPGHIGPRRAKPPNRRCPNPDRNLPIARADRAALRAPANGVPITLCDRAGLGSRGRINPGRCPRCLRRSPIWSASPRAGSRPSWRRAPQRGNSLRSSKHCAAEDCGPGGGGRPDGGGPRTKVSLRFVARRSSRSARVRTGRGLAVRSCRPCPVHSSQKANCSAARCWALPSVRGGRVGSRRISAKPTSSSLAPNLSSQERTTVLIGSAPDWSEGVQPIDGNNAGGTLGGY